MLGTLVEISLAGRGENELHEAATVAFTEIERMHVLMSAYSVTSDVYRVNNAPVGSTVPIDPHTWRVLDLANTISCASNGVFDVTIGAAMMKYGGRPRSARGIPDSQATFRDIELLPGNCVRLRRALAIDLGGIAKGYAVDIAVGALRKRGAHAGCVNAGGDVRVFGEAVQMVHVRDPLEPSMARAQVGLHECALATSAKYEKKHGYNASGILLDPRKSDDVVSERSASVRAPSCALADALAKCVFMLGQESATLLQHFKAEGFLIEDARVAAINTKKSVASESDECVLSNNADEFGEMFAKYERPAMTRSASGTVS